MQSAAEHQPPKSLEWSWDQQLKSPMSSRSPSSLSWDMQPSRSPWFSTATPVTEDTTANNINSLMTGSMTTTCCSSIGSSGGEVIIYCFCYLPVTSGYFRLNRHPSVGSYPCSYNGPVERGYSRWHKIVTETSSRRIEIEAFCFMHVLMVLYYYVQNMYKLQFTRSHCLGRL